MSGFTLLWNKILRSSLWVQESKETRLVWITLIALKDKDGNVFASVIGLADAAKVSLEECRDALNVLLSPDPNDTSKVNEGRRITEIQGGWHITNHELYRFSNMERRVIWAEQKANQRKRDYDSNRRHQSKPAVITFQKPSPEEASLYAEKLGMPQEERIKFLDYYESNGWRVGKNPMRSWQAAMRNWKNNIKTYGSKTNQPNPRNIGVIRTGPSYGDLAREKLRRQNEKSTAGVERAMVEQLPQPVHAPSPPEAA